MDAVIATSDRSGSFLEVPHTVIQHGVDLKLFHPPETADDRMAATDLPGKYLDRLLRPRPPPEGH